MRTLLRRIGLALALWRLFGPAVSPRFTPGQEHPWRLRGHTVYVGDREFLVRTVGPEDGRNVVFIHGLGGSSLAEWYEIGPLLSDRYRLTIIDHRSHGLSARSAGPFEIDDAADDVAAVLDAIGVRSAGVVGYSMGGAIAQSLAYRHPAKVDSLVLIGTFAFHPPAWRFARMIGIWLTRTWERLTGTGTPEVRAGYLLATGAVAPRHARWMWEETHRRDPEAGAEAGFALLRFDSRTWIGRLELPALVVIPTADQLVPSSWQYDLAARLKGAEVLEIPGARHEAPWTHAGLIARRLDEFLGSVAVEDLSGHEADNPEDDKED